MPPEHVETKRGLALWPRDAWMILLQLPRFPTDGISDGKELWAQSRIRLAWQGVAGLLFFE